MMLRAARGTPELVEGQARRCSCVAKTEADATQQEETTEAPERARLDHWHGHARVETATEGGGPDVRAFRLGKELFARKPQEAVHLWAEAGVFGAASPCDAAVAKFLFSHEELDRRALWEFLASSKPVLEAYVRLFDVRDRPLDEALREVFGALGVFASPSDALHNWGSRAPSSSRSWRRSLGKRSSTGSSASSSSAGSSRRSRRRSRRFSTSSNASRSVSFSRRLRRRASFSSSSHARSRPFDTHSGDTHNFPSPTTGESYADSPRSHFGPGDDMDGEAWRANESDALEHKRFACQTFADWYWSLNEDIVAAWLPSAKVVFALVIQLVSLSENRAAYLAPRTRYAASAGITSGGGSSIGSGGGVGASQARSPTRSAAVDAAASDFVETCQNVMMSLDAPNLRETMLVAMFRRVYAEPFGTPLRYILAAESTLSSLSLSSSFSSSTTSTFVSSPSPAELSHVAASGEGFCQGYLWLPTLDALPCPWERRWVVLADWVLYVYRSSREPGELLMIAPLSNVEPDLRAQGVYLEGRMKVALTKGALEAPEGTNQQRTRQTSNRPKRRPWYTRMFSLASPAPPASRAASRQQGSSMRGRGHGASPLIINSLEFVAQSPSDALRWLDAFRGGLHSPEGAKSAEFAANVERYCNEDEGHAARVSASASAHAKIMHDLEWANRRGEVTQGVLWIRKPAFRDDEVASGKQKETLDDLYSIRFTERYCSLLGKQMVVSKDSTSLDHHGVIDLSKLRMLVPTNHKWAKEQGLFPFELVNSELQVLCACAAPTLKDYVLWNNALTPLLPSKGKAAQPLQQQENQQTQEESEIDETGAVSSNESGLSSDDDEACSSEEEKLRALQETDGEEEEEEEEEKDEETKIGRVVSVGLEEGAAGASETANVETRDDPPSLASVPQTLEELTNAYASLIGKATALLNRDIDADLPQDTGVEHMTSPTSSPMMVPTPAPPSAPMPTPPAYDANGVIVDSLPKPDKKRRRENTPRAGAASASPFVGPGPVEEIPPTPTDVRRATHAGDAAYAQYGFRTPSAQPGPPPPSMPPPTPPFARHR